jgi:hypothetical protein
MLGLRQPTAADQMRETGLMDRLRETPRGRPAIADDDAGEVLAEQLRETRGLTESRRRLCLASRPFQSHCTVPATFQPVSSGVTTGTPADCLAERVIRGLRLTRGAVYRVCTRPLRVTVAHAPVLPEPRDLYKSDPSNIAVRDGRARARTR